jgi:uncharacterized membrane protein YfcA
MLLVALVAFASALLTLFSGFGLGTLLLPAFAVFFPLPVAVAATGVVHLANNLFKAALLGRHTNWHVYLCFAIPGAIAAFLGALALDALAGTAPLASYEWNGRVREITPMSLAIGGLILSFAVVELHPRASEVSFPRRFLPLGGVLSGFLGGISGHQGALRTAFLLRLQLSREAFLATGILSAVTIDCVRLVVYGTSQWRDDVVGHDGLWPMVGLGIAAAFAGSYLGKRLMHKVTMRSIQILVGVMLVVLGAALAVDAV